MKSETYIDYSNGKDLQDVQAEVDMFLQRVQAAEVELESCNSKQRECSLLIDSHLPR